MRRSVSTRDLHRTGEHLRVLRDTLRFMKERQHHILWDPTQAITINSVGPFTIENLESLILETKQSLRKKISSFKGL